jgi:hypothetical protein
MVLTGVTNVLSLIKYVRDTENGIVRNVRTASMKKLYVSDDSL